jgi:hypothetical protein
LQVSTLETWDMMWKGSFLLIVTVSTTSVLGSRKNC